MKALTPDEFGWLLLQHITLKSGLTMLEKASLIPASDESEERKAAVREAIRDKKLGDAILTLPDGRKISTADEFSRTVHTNRRLIGDFVPNGPAKEIHVTVKYSPEQGQFTVNTSEGPVRIGGIDFKGNYKLTETKQPITAAARYSKAESGKPIAEVASFEFTANRNRLSLELSRLKGTEETHVVIRKLGEGDAET